MPSHEKTGILVLMKYYHTTMHACKKQLLTTKAIAMALAPMGPSP